MKENLDSNLDIAVQDTIIHSLEYRNPFQIKVFTLLIKAGELDENNTDEMARYSKIISDYIDNPENTSIRRYIISKDFDKAAEIMNNEIHRDGRFFEAA